jgi:hypothetical protein
MEDAILRYSLSIKKGFPRTIGFLFATKSLTGVQTPMDLSLYVPKFAVKLGDTRLVIVPTISIPDPISGWAFFTFLGSQTEAMTEGLWDGNSLLVKTSDGSISHEFDVQIEVRVSIAKP